MLRVMETTPFTAAAHLPLQGTRLWLSFPPDHAGDMVRWLADPAHMAHLAQHSKKIYLAAPDVLESIADELKAGTPEPVVARDVSQNMQAYKWYTERVDHPATPEELVRLVTTAQKSGVELVALSAGPSIHPETEKSLQREHDYWGKPDKTAEPVTLRSAAAALFSPVRSVAEGVQEDVRARMLSDRANFNISRAMDALSEENGPFILIYDAPKHSRTRPIAAVYEKAYGQPLTQVDLERGGEALVIDMSGLQGMGAQPVPTARPSLPKNQSFSPSNP